MKNIHVLPTSKPSRLWITWEKQLGLHPTITNSLLDKQHIYITNDEEIKEGDWVLSENKLYQIKESAKDFLNHVQGISKKIILTTDQDLIADGVQAIDDDFLEWFVKNPSCENIKVNPYCEKLACQNTDCNICCQELKYKIIIPQEEPKQETLEEAALRKYPLNYHTSQHNPNNILKRDIFKEGAKWQAEIMYSEEEVLDLLHRRNFDLKHKKDTKTTKEWFEQFKK
jgi:hypothetical protein